jgi:hypothetical protein
VPPVGKRGAKRRPKRTKGQADSAARAAKIEVLGASFRKLFSNKQPILHGAIFRGSYHFGREATAETDCEYEHIELDIDDSVPGSENAVQGTLLWDERQLFTMLLQSLTRPRDELDKHGRLLP